MLDPRMQRAVEEHMGTAESLAWNFFSKLPGGSDLDELRSVALEALVKAASRWVDPYCSSRGFDPFDPADPSKPERHFPGYAIKTVRGALIDWARHQDHMTRSGRAKVKALQAAQDAGARGEAELAAAAGLSVEKAREVLAAASAKPVSLDGSVVQADYAGDSPSMLADDGADVEGQAEMNDVMRAFLETFDRLDAET